MNENLFSLSPVALFVRELFGQLPCETFEIEFDFDKLLLVIISAKHIAFNEERIKVTFTKGLVISAFFQNENKGYWGTYLN